jgi:RimJ/RimL family protein N-acetyltransferase
MQVLLETERLFLRRFTEADAEFLFELDNDPEVMRFINGGTPTPRDVIRNDILPGFLHYDEGLPGYGVWAAVEKASGDLLGWLSFRPGEGAPSEVVLGYRFRRNAWGKGYATEGARALVRMGFSELGVQRVVAAAYEDNLASRRVMQKLGMTLVREFRMTSEDLRSQGCGYLLCHRP